MQSIMMGIVSALHKEITFDMVVTDDSSCDYLHAFISYGGKIIKVLKPKNKKTYIRRVLLIKWLVMLPVRIYRIIKENGPYEAIHCHNLFEAGLCNMGAFFADVPIRIAHSHGSGFPQKNIKSYVYSKVLRLFVNAFSTCNIGCSKEACEYLYGRNKTYVVINNGIDTEQKFNLNSYLNEHKRAYAFVHIGRFDDNKNQQFVLKVFAKISEMLPEATLEMVGSGPRKKALTQLIKDLNLQEKVLIHPHDYDIPKLLAESSYMIFPSFLEGFGLALIEAQMMGVYCFASSTVPHNTDAGLIEYLDLKLGAQYWADSIQKFINNNRNKQIYKGAAEKYDIRRIAMKYKEIYSHNMSSL